MNYVKAITFSEKPDYQYLIDLFKQILVRECSQIFIFDWCQGKITDVAEIEENSFSSLNENESISSETSMKEEASSEFDDLFN